MNEIEKAAREYASVNKQYSPVNPTRQTVMDEQIKAFKAGHDFALSMASDKKLAEVEAMRDKWVERAHIESDRLAIAVEALQEIADYGEYSDHKDTPKIYREAIEALNKINQK